MTKTSEENDDVTNQIISTLSNNLIKLLKLSRTNEAELARKLNITYNTIHRLVSGTTSDPKLSTLNQIAKYFNVSLDMLLSDQSKFHGLDGERPRFVPIFTWEAIKSNNFMRDFNYENWEKWLPIATNEKNIINDNCYALASTKSMQPRFPIGTTFIIKPDEPPIDGDLIIIKFKDDQSVSLRELIIDSPEWQLCPISPGSKNLILDNEKIEIIGVVILTLIQTRV